MTAFLFSLDYPDTGGLSRAPLRLLTDIMYAHYKVLCDLFSTLPSSLSCCQHLNSQAELIQVVFHHIFKVT